MELTNAQETAFAAIALATKTGEDLCYDDIHHMTRKALLSKGIIEEATPGITLRSGETVRLTDAGWDYGVENDYLPELPKIVASTATDELDLNDGQEEALALVAEANGDDLAMENARTEIHHSRRKALVDRGLIEDDGMRLHLTGAGAHYLNTRNEGISEATEAEEEAAKAMAEAVEAEKARQAEEEAPEEANEADEASEADIVIVHGMPIKLSESGKRFLIPGTDVDTNKADHAWTGGYVLALLAGHGELETVGDIREALRATPQDDRPMGDKRANHFAWTAYYRLLKNDLIATDPSAEKPRGLHLTEAGKAAVAKAKGVLPLDICEGCGALGRSFFSEDEEAPEALCANCA